jgi:hypothetical protein
MTSDRCDEEHCNTLRRQAFQDRSGDFSDLAQDTSISFRPSIECRQAIEFVDSTSIRHKLVISRHERANTDTDSHSKRPLKYYFEIIISNNVWGSNELTAKAVFAEVIHEAK